jgi:hypothetical protein
MAGFLAMAAEDIRELQPWTYQRYRALSGRLGLGLLLGLVVDLVLLRPQRREAIEGTHDLVDRVGDARVERRRLKLGMSKRTRVILSTSLRKSKDRCAGFAVSDFLTSVAKTATRHRLAHR